MPLSEQEQRLLDEMERNLYQNDADFVATVGSHHGRPNYRGIVIGVILVVVGIITLIIGVSAHQPLIGVLGFVLMFAGVLIAITPSRKSRIPNSMPTSGGAQPKSRRNGGFMSTINDRWERREEERGN